MVCCGCPYINKQTENIDSCFCKKVDNYIYVTGSCEEDNIMPPPLKQNPRKLNRYERKIKYKHKLVYLADACMHWYPAGAYRVDYDGWWTNDPQKTKYIKRAYRANHAPGRSGFLKKRASRAFRRYKGKLANGCAYKKTFDYWWELT